MYTLTLHILFYFGTKYAPAFSRNNRKRNKHVWLQNFVRTKLYFKYKFQIQITLKI